VNGSSLPSAPKTFGTLEKVPTLARAQSPDQTRGVALAPANSAVSFHMLTNVPRTPAPASAFAPNLAASAKAHALDTSHVHVPCNFAPAIIDDSSSSTDPGTITVPAAASAPAPALATAARKLASYVFKTMTQVFETSHAEDFRWMEISSAENCDDGKVVMDTFFLKGLSVNPELFFEKDACTPYEWSHVVLLALYYGDDIEGTTNKSIWHSVNNNTPFAIVWPSVRGRIEKCIDALQLRATKSCPLESYGRRNGIVPVENVKVKFSVKQHATMETLLNMPDKVR
jgi:hypothetical protein